ncbi:hypothetical protein DV736_g5174, partial [Chaetothyriales sp. CBS 134916]
MVSTRHHPRQFPEPATPASRSTKCTPAKTKSTSISKVRSRPTSPTGPASSAVVDGANTANGTVIAKPAPLRRKRNSTRAASTQTYTHTIDTLTILWLSVSLPLVFWDIGYVVLRPHSMPGGKFHSPVWIPYGLYAAVDYLYGFPAWNNGVGFTAAQTMLNVIETLMYCYYLYILAVRGKGTGWIAKLWTQKFSTTTGTAVTVKGQGVAFAVLVAYAAAVMTVSKTALYWLNEYFSNFENIGHNSVSTLFWLWIVPNGAWLVFPSWMIYVLGTEIVAAMNEAGYS